MFNNDGFVAHFLKFIPVLLMLATLGLPQHAVAENKGVDSVLMKDPGSELWRNVRQRQMADAVTQVRSTDANVLIRAGGESWRQYRMDVLIPRAGGAIFLALFGVFVFRLLRGKMNLPEGRSGLGILRFTLNQRVAHWSVAILFVILALTGLALLLGRKFLIPMFGNEGFSYIAVTAKTLHDYLGPAFAVALIFLFVLFVRDNIFSPSVDGPWLLKGGGLIGEAHPSSGKFNTGEKGWFWIAVIAGTVISISGLVLDFPIFGQTRETMEYYHFLHSVAAVTMIVASFGHIYMGTVGVEATFEVMQTGYCDANWAKEHHDLWYDEVKHSAVERESAPSATGSQRESIDNA